MSSAETGIMLPQDPMSTPSPVKAEEEDLSPVPIQKPPHSVAPAPVSCAGRKRTRRSAKKDKELAHAFGPVIEPTETIVDGFAFLAWENITQLEAWFHRISTPQTNECTSVKKQLPSSEKPSPPAEPVKRTKRPYRRKNLKEQMAKEQRTAAIIDAVAHNETTPPPSEDSKPTVDPSDVAQAEPASVKTEGDAVMTSPMLKQEPGPATNIAAVGPMVQQEGEQPTPGEGGEAPRAKVSEAPRAKVSRLEWPDPPPTGPVLPPVVDNGGNNGDGGEPLEPSTSDRCPVNEIGIVKATTAIPTTGEDVALAASQEKPPLLGKTTATVLPNSHICSTSLQPPPAVSSHQQGTTDLPQPPPSSSVTATLKGEPRTPREDPTPPPARTPNTRVDFTPSGTACTTTAAPTPVPPTVYIHSEMHQHQHTHMHQYHHPMFLHPGGGQPPQATPPGPTPPSATSLAPNIQPQPHTTPPGQATRGGVSNHPMVRTLPGGNPSPAPPHPGAGTPLPPSQPGTAAYNHNQLASMSAALAAAGSKHLCPPGGQPQPPANSPATAPAPPSVLNGHLPATGQSPAGLTAVGGSSVPRLLADAPPSSTAGNVASNVVLPQATALPSVKKGFERRKGRWCALHGKIAYMIYRKQQEQKESAINSLKRMSTAQTATAPSLAGSAAKMAAYSGSIASASTSASHHQPLTASANTANPGPGQRNDGLMLRQGSTNTPTSSTASASTGHHRTSAVTIANNAQHTAIHDGTTSNRYGKPQNHGLSVANSLPSTSYAASAGLAATGHPGLNYGVAGVGNHALGSAGLTHQGAGSVTLSTGMNPLMARYAASQLAAANGTTPAALNAMNILGATAGLPTTLDPRLYGLGAAGSPLLNQMFPSGGAGAPSLATAGLQLSDWASMLQLLSQVPSQAQLLSTLAATSQASASAALQQHASRLGLVGSLSGLGGSNQQQQHAVHSASTLQGHQGLMSAQQQQQQGADGGVSTMSSVGGGRNDLSDRHRHFGSGAGCSSTGGGGGGLSINTGQQQHFDALAFAQQQHYFNVLNSNAAAAAGMGLGAPATGHMKLPAGSDFASSLEQLSKQVASKSGYPPR